MEAYPFAFIVAHDASSGLVHRFIAHEYQNYKTISYDDGETFSYYGNAYDDSDPKFVAYVKTQLDYDWKRQDNIGYATVDKGSKDVIWTNFELKYADGSTYCTKSDPVSVTVGDDNADG